MSKSVALGLEPGLLDNFHFHVQGRHVYVPINKMLIGGSGLIRSMESSSNIELKVLDPKKLLQKEGFFVIQPNKHHNNSESIEYNQVELQILRKEKGKPTKELWFQLCSVNKRAYEYTLIFEDRLAAIFREYTVPFQHARSENYQFPHFVKDLVFKAAPHCTFKCPGLNHKQPIKTAEQEELKAGHSGKGNKTYFIEGVKADADQTKNINIALSVAENLRAPHDAVLASICAGIGESGFRTNATDGVTGTHHGVWQSDIIPATEVERMAKAFFRGGESFQGGGAIKLAREGKTPGEIATTVEDSGEPPEFYGKHQKNAEEIVSAYGGISTTKTKKSHKESIVEPHVYQFNIKGSESENTTENLLEYLSNEAQKLKWKFFVSEETAFYYDSEELLQQLPVMELNEETDGVVSINFELDRNTKKKPESCIVECRAPIWLANPGETIFLEKNSDILKDCGPVVGKWIVGTFARRDLENAATEIQLTKGEPAEAEEADKIKAVKGESAVKVTKDATGQHTANQLDSQGTFSPSSLIANVYFNCNYIANHKPPYTYVWGGGHNQLAVPTKGPFAGGSLEGGLTHVEGYDCSGAVSAALGGGNANLVTAPMTTDGFAHWGVSGKGEELTLWVSNSGNPHTSHVFLEFTGAVSGGKTKFWEAGGILGTKVGWSGSNRSTSGFEPRHWPNV